MQASHAAGLTRHGIAALCMLSGFSATAWAANAAAADTAATTGQASGVQTGAAEFDVDIPAQALSDALKQFAGLTLQSTVFRSDIVTGKTSSAVHGRYRADVALRLLLAGTGLSVATIGSGASAALVLREDDGAGVAGATTALTSPQAIPPGLAGYPALLQARILDMLCNDGRAAPGNYRMLLRFRVDGNGRVRQPSLLNSTGDPQRDAAVLTAMQRVQLDTVPPADMPQPVTMLIVPHASGASRQCPAGAS